MQWRGVMQLGATVSDCIHCIPYAQVSQWTVNHCEQDEHTQIDTMCVECPS